MSFQIEGLVANIEVIGDISPITLDQTNNVVGINNTTPHSTASSASLVVTGGIYSSTGIGLNTNPAANAWLEIKGANANQLSILLDNNADGTASRFTPGQALINAGTGHATLCVQGSAAFGTYYNFASPPANGLIVSGNSGFGMSNPSSTVGITGTLQYVDGNQASGKVLTSDGSGNATWQAATGGGGPTTQNVVTSSRVADTTYQNTGTTPMYVAITATFPNSTEAYFGASTNATWMSSPQTSDIIADVFNSSITGIEVSVITFVVLPNYYYGMKSVGGTPGVIVWTEWS